MRQSDAQEGVADDDGDHGGVLAGAGVQSPRLAEGAELPSLLDHPPARADGSRGGIAQETVQLSPLVLAFQPGHLVVVGFPIQYKNGLKRGDNSDQNRTLKERKNNIKT